MVKRTYVLVLSVVAGYVLALLRVAALTKECDRFFGGPIPKEHPAPCPFPPNKMEKEGEESE